jgi:methionine synthase II (cobalamin-independent)
VPRIKGRILPPEDPARFTKIQDLDFIRGRFPDLPFKVSLTGPTTFAFACAASGAGPAYRGATDPALQDDLTEGIRLIAREVGRRGVQLQLDDPILSQGMRDYDSALRRLDVIASEAAREKVSVHVCGGLARGKVLEALLRLKNVSTLNLAFAGRMERENLSLLERRAWEDHDMFLGAGCISVQVARAEDVMTAEAVANLLRSVSDRVSGERIRYVLPDCGLRATPAEFVSQILENMHRGFDMAFAWQA